MNDESTYITEITYKFEDWNFGGVIRSGSISVSSNPGWTISNRNFTISNDLDPDPFKKESFTISGSFSENGDQASGTWETFFKGTTYNRNWDAIPKNY